jgi:SNF2 family DNA or RNA helicase
MHSHIINRKGKILIFSSYDVSFDIIRRSFDLYKINYAELTGSKATRESKIKKFHEGKVDVIFLNSRFSGAGLNLQDCTDIIFYHDMDRDTREQNIGRALRIGREIDLYIHDFVYTK